jgi:ABC-2 type transport system ATP-binding protein
MEESIVKTRAVGKKYGERYAVLDLNVEIRRGQIYGLIGQNGAGKTTFIRMLTGLITPTEGRIELFGDGGKQALQKARRRIGSIVETPALYPGMTACQNLGAQARLMGLADSAAVIGEALELAGLGGAGSKKVRDFSLGMRQRLALAQAMLTNPEFLVLDEPVNGLDPKGIIENRELLKRLVAEKGMTILVASHILSELSLLATDYGIIDNGRLIKQISANELQSECRQFIRLLTAETEKAVSFLQYRFHVRDMEIAAVGGLKKEIRVFEQLDHITQMNMALCKEDIPVASISMEGQDLESYFMKLTNSQPLTGGLV